LLYKRFHQARFELPVAATGQRVLHIDAAHSPRFSPACPVPTAEKKRHDGTEL
jgi:hypothetical protein